MRLLLTCLLIFSSLNSWAQDSRQSYSTSKKLPSKTLKATSPWSFDLGYSGSTNLLEDGAKTFNHAIGLSSGYKINQAWSAGASIDFAYQSIDREIIREETEDQSHLGDVSGGLSYSHGWQGLKWNHNASVTLPTSQASQDEGYKGIFSLRTMTPIYFPDQSLTMRNSLGFTYILNTFDTSPTTGTSSPEWTLSYALGLSVKINRQWSVGASLNMRSTKSLDGVNEFKATNSLSTAFNWGAWSSRLIYSNGPAPENTRDMTTFEIAHIDRYSQMLAWELGCSF